MHILALNFPLPIRAGIPLPKIFTNTMVYRLFYFETKAKAHQQTWTQKPFLQVFRRLYAPCL